MGKRHNHHARGHAKRTHRWETRPTHPLTLIPLVSGTLPREGVRCQLRAGAQLGHMAEGPVSPPEPLCLSSPLSRGLEDPRTLWVFPRNLWLDCTPYITPWQPGKSMTFHSGWNHLAQNPLLSFFFFSLIFWSTLCWFLCSFVFPSVELFYMYIFFQIVFHYRLLPDIEKTSLCRTVNPVAYLFYV